MHQGVKVNSNLSKPFLPAFCFHVLQWVMPMQSLTLTLYQCLSESLDSSRFQKALENWQQARKIHIKNHRWPHWLNFSNQRLNTQPTQLFGPQWPGKALYHFNGNQSIWQNRSQIHPQHMLKCSYQRKHLPWELNWLCTIQLVKRQQKDQRYLKKPSSNCDKVIKQVADSEEFRLENNWFRELCRLDWYVFRKNHRHETTLSWLRT